ncbi:acyl-CoA dehydrogenase FadE [Paraneptunicella aestuarii]|uniref:acyl-CoA dehydrogenase FadE n=1 Tax=Paraneptunicella aestuarii TaxID=2831148 RepID=UPI001E5CF6C2|nr:acyl-CoA dehydrogenase FadE [Paraneptunicella aestuarii]UAA40324.1 acyl-CoA dehydrogenase FadE [Paraneptunicella aestuarii]
MYILAWVFVLIALIGVSSYFRIKLFNATLAVAVWMLIGTSADIVGTVSWLVFLALAIPLNSPSIRKQYLSKPALNLYRKIMPEMSSTERDAIDAGTVWWDGEIFSGNPNWNNLHAIPEARLSPEEQAFLDGPVETVCSMVNDWDVTHRRTDLPPEVWQYLKDNKFFAMIIKKEYGGLDFSAYAQSRVLQKLSGVSSVLSSTVGVPNSLGPGELLQHYGTEAQKQHYLPALAKGDAIPCFALTSPEAGSDAGAIPDLGVVCKGQWNGEEIIGMKLTFNKRYITLAPVATVVGLAFKMVDPDGLLGDKKDIGITCALIPSDTEGLDIGNRHFPLNVPFQNGPVRGKDIFVPLDYIIGGPEMAGHGWRMLVECLSVGRCITLPSNSTGGVKTIALATGAYARIRRQFKLPIAKMEGIEEMLGHIGGNAYMMDAITRFATKGVDLGEKPSVISAIAKYHTTEKMRQAVTNAMDIHGGKGVMLGPNNYLGRGYQGAPIAITVEGANILTRNMMIYGQGALRCHPYVLKEMQASANPDESQALEEFDNVLFGHVGFAISNFARSFWFGWGGSHLVGTPFNDQTKGYYQSMTKFSSNLALLSDLCMAVLGGELKRKERISARLGDILSYLFIGSTILKRFDDEGRKSDDAPMMHWAMQDSLYRAETAMVDLLDNFPIKAMGMVLKVMIMPFGRRHKKPSDILEHKIAHILQTPCEARNRLGEGQYLTDHENNPFGQLETALKDILNAEPIFDRVCKAAGEKLPFTQLNLVADKGLELGVINEKEADLLRKTEEERLRVINVDDFDPAELLADKSKKTEKASSKAA